MLIAKAAFALFEKRYDWRNPIRSVTSQAINLVPQDTPRQVDLFMNIEKKMCIRDRDKHTYSFKDEESGNSIEITMEVDENAFLILAQRYKELSAASPDDPGSQDIDIPVSYTHLMIQASDFCVFYFNDEYLPESRKESKKAITSYQPKSGTRLAFDLSLIHI